MLRSLPTLRRARRLACLFAGLLAAAPSGAAEPPSADLVLRGGRIATLDPARPEASALAARGGRIVAVGSDAEIAAAIGPATRVVELAGRRAVPGFVEGHAHFAGLGQAASILRLAPTKSWDEVVAAVAAAVARAEPGEWILGRGWHQEKWTATPEPNVAGFPVHATLSRVSPDNPVVLTHASGHASFVNAKAMELAGIEATTPDPPGGEILRDGLGAPTGLLNETAQELVAAGIDRFRRNQDPAAREREARRALELANAEVLSKGITSFHDAGASFADIDRVAAFAADGELGVRLYVMVGDSLDAMRQKLAASRRTGAFDGKLTVRAIKAYVDGALGSRGAWLLAPYSDLPSTSGLAVTPLADLRAIADLALANDYQLAIHAIGDRGNREVLDIFEQKLAAVADGKARRWRIEHAQHLDPADIPRFGRLGVIASMQGVHCTSDAPFVVTRLGETRAREGAYVWRRLVDTGAVVVNGTDAPVEDVDPIPSFYATVTRRLPDGSRFYPEHALTRREALATYTRDAAYAAFEEHDKGTLEVGKLADVTVLS
ncbi:MAG: amidohydrolase, partial [Thermoanaerobaculia bacterium]|nr:amidohydrolase [Thermoanaerobaculia bacterium]